MLSVTHWGIYTAHVAYCKRKMDARQRKPVSNQDRQRLVDCYEGGEDFVSIAEQLGIHVDTARSVIRVWMSEGRVEAKARARGGARNRRRTSTDRPYDGGMEIEGLHESCSGGHHGSDPPKVCQLVQAR